jgi:hypothetical protein
MAAMHTHDETGSVYLSCMRCTDQTEFQFGDLAGTGTLDCGHCGAALDRALLGRIRIALRTDYVRRRRASMAGLKTAS